MRTINLIVIHCSATREDRPFNEQALEAAHRLRGIDGIGYHFYIRSNGDIKSTRPLDCPGAHARGYNAHSIGICYEGGLDADGKPADTRTEAQKATMHELLVSLCMDYPEAEIIGHRDLPWVKKACPCFDVKKWLATA